jgi:hypothetical protein
MLFPNEIQAALLFGGKVDILDAAVRNFVRIEEARSGVRLAMPERKPGVFYRLFGSGEELMITIEYVDAPALPEVFEQALGSTITSIMCPDIRQRLVQNRSHILINVSHGVLGDAPEIQRMLQQIDYPVAGQSLPQFIKRLDLCALISRIVCDEQQPQVVHWTQSNQLIPGEIYDGYAQGAAPTPLHVHPFLFGAGKAANSEPQVGIRTFGARHFIGGEIVVEPSVLPWAANFDTILAFLRVATIQNGYIIPNGDTFGPEDRSLSYRVLHRPPDDGDVPVYELQPLMHRQFGFVADGYVPRDRVIDDRAPPQELMPTGEEAAELAEEWRAKRALAEGIGGTFEVRSRGPEDRVPPPSASPPSRPGSPLGGNGLGNRPVFGRKRA